MKREEILAKFGALILEKAGWLDPSEYGIGDIDGGDLQELATELGILESRQHTALDAGGEEDCPYAEGPDKVLRCDGGEGCSIMFLRKDILEFVKSAHDSHERRER